MQAVDTDLVIIGAGPAGLTAAQYGARANLRTTLIEEMAIGGQSLLIDHLENYPGYVEPRSGFDLAQDMYRQAEKFGAQFLNDSVTALRKENDIFVISLGSGNTLTAYAVVLATGAKHRTLDVPGEAEFSGRGVSYCATCDGPFFKGKKMFVVGGGDAACDEAQFLSKLSDQIVMVHRRDRFRAQKALAERVLHNPAIQVRFNHRIVEIKGDTKVRSVVLENLLTGERYEEATEAVFIFVGSIPQTALVPEAEKDEAGYIITDQRMESSIKGLFVAGDVRATPFRQVVVAAGEGAIAAHSAAQYIDELKGEAYR
ncbi:MAG: thioredoxin-disulfide reductase [Treponemataceae bacterium]|nr:thioredoxin-disulfide reductase [Treponemataceae bacterium]